MTADVKYNKVPTVALQMAALAWYDVAEVTNNPGLKIVAEINARRADRLHWAADNATRNRVVVALASELDLLQVLGWIGFGNAVVDPVHLVAIARRLADAASKASLPAGTSMAGKGESLRLVRDKGIHKSKSEAVALFNAMKPTFENMVKNGEVKVADLLHDEGKSVGFALVGLAYAIANDVDVIISVGPDGQSCRITNLSGEGHEIDTLPKKGADITAYPRYKL